MAEAIEEIVDSFQAAQTAADDAERSGLLAAAITDDAVFDGLQQRLEGRDAIFRDFRGDHRLVRTSPVQVRGDWIRWRWEVRTADGTVPTADDGTPYAGTAVGRLGTDGRLDLIVPFLDG